MLDKQITQQLIDHLNEELQPAFILLLGRTQKEQRLSFRLEGSFNMSDIYATLGYSMVGLIILIPTIYHFLKKKRSHKEFYFVVISCFAFFFLVLYLFK